MHVNDILWIFNKNSRKFFLRCPPHPSTWLLINCSLECSLSLVGWEHTKSFATSYREGSDKRFEHHVWKALLSPSNRAQNVCAPKEDVNNADLIYTFAALLHCYVCVSHHIVCAVESVISFEVLRRRKVCAINYCIRKMTFLLPKLHWQKAACDALEPDLFAGWLSKQCSFFWRGAFCFVLFFFTFILDYAAEIKLWTAEQKIPNRLHFCKLVCSSKNCD